MTSHTSVRGSAFIVLSAVLFGSYGIWARLMVGSFGEFSQAWTRGLLLLCIIFLINLRWRVFQPIARKDIPWFLIIASAAGLNQAPYFFGFTYLHIGTATLLFYAALVVGGYVIGKVVFNEAFTPIKWGSLALAFAGMFAIYQLTLTGEQLLAAVLTIVAGIMGALCVVLPKKLSNTYSELHILTGNFTVMLIANGILAYLFHEALPSFEHPTAWLAQCGYAIAMLLANWFVIEGFKYVDASIGSLIGLTEIVFGILFGVIFFHESITFGMGIGALFIMLSAVLPDCAAWCQRMHMKRGET